MRHPLVRTGDLEASLAGWLPRQRWFGGKGREVDKVTVVSQTPLVRGDPGLHHVIVAAHQQGTVERYQLLIGIREKLPERLEHVRITQSRAVWLYDGAHDPDLMPALLELLDTRAELDGLSFQAPDGVRLTTGLSSFVSQAEQSNTSVVFGSQPGPAYILKLFRKPAPGTNPDLELNLGLSRVGCTHVPRLLGWLTDDSGGTLAMLAEFLSTAAEGWGLATASVRDLLNKPADQVNLAETAGGDFAAEAERLGAATAEVHRDLAAAFGVDELPADRMRELADGMRRQLWTAIGVVPALGDHAGVLGSAFDELAELSTPIPVQPVHGDYHLGQVLRSETGWIALDFEGEPGRDAGERRAWSHPLKDVAGMLRSFEYAARYMLPSPEEPRLEALARDWADRNRAAFCRGYARAGGPDPDAHQTLLRAFEYDKAVYEVLYEANNRPDWIRIPLGSLPR